MSYGQSSAETTGDLSLRQLAEQRTAQAVVAAVPRIKMLYHLLKAIARRRVKE